MTPDDGWRDLYGWLVWRLGLFRSNKIFVFFFFQAEDGIRDRDGWLEFRRVLFRSAIQQILNSSWPHSILNFPQLLFPSHLLLCKCSYVAVTRVNIQCLLGLFGNKIEIPACGVLAIQWVQLYWINERQFSLMSSTYVSMVCLCLAFFLATASCKNSVQFFCR